MLFNNPVLVDLTNRLQIQPTTVQGSQKLEQFAEIYAGMKSQQAVQEAVQNALNPNSLDVAINRRVQMKIFGGKAF